MKYTIELDYEMVDKIITQELKDTYQSFMVDYENRQKGSLAIFDHDVEEDKKEIQKHMDALKLILKYYGEDIE